MAKRGPQPRTEAERFWAMVKKTDSCWLWTGAVNSGKNGKGGYGKFMVRKIDGKSVFEASHRWSYRNNIGAISDGLFVLHRCDNRICVRPDHLFLGSAQDNVDDMILKNRRRGPIGATHPSAKLDSQSIIEIQTRYLTGDWSQRALADAFGVDPSSISRIVRGESWARTVSSSQNIDRSFTWEQQQKNIPRGDKHPASKLTTADVMEIRRKYSLGGISQASLASDYGVTQTALGSIVHRRTWKSLPNDN